MPKLNLITLKLKLKILKLNLENKFNSLNQYGATRKNPFKNKIFVHECHETNKPKAQIAKYLIFYLKTKSMIYALFNPS